MKIRLHFLSLALACVLARQAQAEIYTFSASGRGSLTNTGDSNGNFSNNNYIAGRNEIARSFRNHFDFSIPAFSGTLQSATLSLDNSSGPGPGHSGGTHTYSVYSLGAFGSYTYAGIGAGTAYGSVSISAIGTQLISLNAAALPVIIQNQGSMFSLGGVNSGEGASSPEYDFGSTGSGSVTRLTLNAVPFPVRVGNAGNAPDSTGFGAVAYNYRMGASEVTNAQYAQFLNAKAASDPLGLYNPLMGSDGRSGITRSGASGSYTYAVKPLMGDKPVNYVSWYDAARFANWMNNGQGNGDTETGAYTLLGGTDTPTNGALVTRNPDANSFLPSEDEWYKAAYHQPSAQGGDSDDYWLYPTKTNATPTATPADSSGNIGNLGPNVANYNSLADWNGNDGNVTSVTSASLLSRSFYGTYDQGGNVWEWNEGTWGADRIMRGGSSIEPGSYMASAMRSGRSAENESYDVGFRIANIPEPTTFALALLGVVGLAASGWRWKLLRENCHANEYL